VAAAVTLARAPERLRRMRQDVPESVAHLEWGRVVERFEDLLYSAASVGSER
jgi:hypothetical protein